MTHGDLSSARSLASRRGLCGAMEWVAVMTLRAWREGGWWKTSEVRPEAIGMQSVKEPMWMPVGVEDGVAWGRDGECGFAVVSRVYSS